MRPLKTLLRTIAEAVCAQGLRGLSRFVPFGETVFEIARDTVDRFQRRQLLDEVRESIETLTSTSTEKPPEEVPPLETPLAIQLRFIESTPYAWLLDLTNKRIGDDGLQAVARLPSLINRETLILSGNDIGDEGVKALADSANVVNLTKLVLWDNRITDEGVRAITTSPNFANLTTLDLGRNNIGDEGAVALAESAYMRNLSALILVSNHITDEGAFALARSPHLEQLAELKPLNNNISPAGVTALKQRFGKRVRIY